MITETNFSNDNYSFLISMKKTVTLSGFLGMSILVLTFSCSSGKHHAELAQNDSISADTAAVNSSADEVPADTVTTKGALLSDSGPGFDVIPLETQFQAGKNTSILKRTAKDDVLSRITFRGKGSDERRKGTQLALSGDLKGAVAQYSKSVELAPENPDAYFYRARAKWGLKDIKGAEADFAKAIAIKPTEPVYYFFRGQMYLQQKRNEEALADFNSTVRLSPDFADALDYKGIALSEMGKNAEAVEAYDLAISKVPVHALAYYNKGTALANMKNYAEAEKMFSKSLEIDPEYPQSLNNRGNCRFMMKMYSEAISDYTLGIARQPKNAELLNNRAYAFQRSGKISEACEDWTKAAEMGHSVAAEMLKKYCK